MVADMVKNLISVIFTELATNDEAAAEFFNGIIPQNLVKELAEAEVHK